MLWCLGIMVGMQRNTPAPRACPEEPNTENTGIGERGAFQFMLIGRFLSQARAFPSQVMVTKGVVNSFFLTKACLPKLFLVCDCGCQF